MLRRRIAPPASVVFSSVDAAARRRLRVTGHRLLPYLPPGSHAPPLPWFRGAPPAPPVEAPSRHVQGCEQLEEILDAPARTVADVASSAASGGPLRATATRRMPVLAEPSLDTRIRDIVKVDQSIAAESLPNVVKLLIDPNAEGVENVSLPDFAAMQPRRQLAALGGKRAWHEWVIESTHYKQVARLELESPFYDLRALQNAGITTLYQWAEQPDLVRVSSNTRSLLDAAVERSVEAYVEEVARVVNMGNQLRDVLITWVADVIGKFVLDTLRIPVDQAPTNTSTTTTTTGSNGSSGAAASGSAASGNVSSNSMNVNHSDLSETERVIAAMNGGTMPSSGIGISAGRVCTLEHYHRLARKVLSSVRKEYMVQRHGHEALNGKVVLDSQAEAEIREKAYATLSDALLKVLEMQAPSMPQELHPLRDYGFLALERVPGLLRQAASVLQLQSVPVRYFVFHSTGERECTESEKLEAEFMSDTAAGNNAAAASTSATNVMAPTLASGIFLTGTSNYNVTLGEWSGQTVPAAAAGTFDPVQSEYLSVLRRFKRNTIQVARTSLFNTLRDADAFRNGFNASEALGLQQLFGPAKLVEDRLASVLNCFYNSASATKPLHFIEAGHTCGKTSVLERISRRMSDSGRTAVTVRYSGASTPFMAGLDDHPLAFPARFWFRVALASCPFLVRTEELFTRAPKSVMWWANHRNWSWELYQKLIRLTSDREGVPSSLHAILVDDVDRVLDAMEGRLMGNFTGAVSTISPKPFASPTTGNAETAKGDKKKHASPAAESAGPDGVASTERIEPQMNTTSSQLASNLHYMQNNHFQGTDASSIQGNSGVNNNNNTSSHQNYEQHFFHTNGCNSSVFPFTTDVANDSISKVIVAVGQLDMVFTGHRVSKLFLNQADAPVRRYFIPLANGIGLQQRLRVLPLLSVLYALHQRSRLGFSGLMYEVLKNCPGLLGYTLDVFWSGRAALMDLRGGAPRLMQWSGTHPLLRSYVPSELFAELPQRNYLLRNPPAARLRLVELLQRQLSSPTGYLTTGVDTVHQDERDGLILPHNHTSCQVHPFALFTIFSHQDPLESPREPNVVRAWGEVWAEYCAVVNTMGTTTERKRDAMRVLLHGALLLRAVAVSGAQMNLNLKIPAYGFPVLASDTRVKQRGGGPEPVVAKATADTVRKAIAAYKVFFANTEQTHYPFRPSVGLNGGCDVVSIAGTTMALYDLITTPEALQDISYRFAEALLGVLHCLSKHVVPQDRIRQVHYVSVVSIDHASTIKNMFLTPSTARASSSLSSSSTVAPAAALTGGSVASAIVSDDIFASPPVPVVPYFLDLSAVFEDDVIDRLRALQGVLGIEKEFRTLNDLLDELESSYRVYVHQDVVASQAELESLLSPTLMQLVPDATTLPAYTSEVVSSDALLMDVLLDDDEEGIYGAEVEEVHHESVLVRENQMSTETFADVEHVRESAELLEAMLNDAMVDSGTNTARVLWDQANHESTQAALLSDVAVEDAINNNIPIPASLSLDGLGATPSKQQHHQREDALAWLHDVIAPSHGDGAGVSVKSTLSDNPAARKTPAASGAFELLGNDEEELANETLEKSEEEEEEAEEEEEEGEEEEERVERSSDNRRMQSVSLAKGRSGGGSSSSNSSNKKSQSRSRATALQQQQHRGKAKKKRAPVVLAVKNKKKLSASAVATAAVAAVAAQLKKRHANGMSKRSGKSALVIAAKKSKRK